MSCLNYSKVITRKGKGLSLPVDGTVCTVVIHTDESLNDGERKEIMIGQGDSEIEWIIEDCCRNMKAEEISQVIIHPEQSVNTKTGNVSQKYIIEMSSFEQAKFPWQKTAEERLEIARINKERGTELFKIGEYKAAARRYCRGLKSLIPLISPPGILHNDIDNLKLILYLNLAMCQLKMSQFEHAIKNCSKVLEQEPKNIKALYRRGSAYIEINKLDLAEEDFKKGLETEPDNKLLREHLRKVRDKTKVDVAELSNAMKTFFASR